MTKALPGRRGETEILCGLVAAVTAGHGQVLVMRGEAGIGKTALLDVLVERAAGCTVARATGVESESALAFAGLHQLCAGHLDRLDKLPAPQRAALSTAFGLRSGAAPDRFLVGLGMLTLLSRVAEDRPLICVVDDADRLDRESAQALEFVARRLGAAPVGLVLAGRETEFAGFPELAIHGLGRDDAAALLDSVVSGPLDPRVRERMLAECSGNPRALIELPRGVAAAFGGADPLVRRVLLPESAPPAGQLLLLAAAEPLGDLALLWRAADLLGLDRDPKVAGLVEQRDRVLFRPPPLRSAVYQAATPVERRDVHRALAAATDPAADPDRRAWHLAQAAIGPDEAVAADLERSVDRARAHGGYAAVGAFLELAAALTPDPARRARRTLDAAWAKTTAGAFDEARSLLAAATPLDSALLRARIDGCARDGDDAPPRLQTGEAVLEAVSDDLGPARPLLDAVALLHTHGYAAAAPALRRAVRAFAGDELTGVRLAGLIARDLWEDERWDVLTRRHLDTVRATGALSLLRPAVEARMIFDLHSGNPVPPAGGEERWWARALLGNGLARYEDALAAARQVTADPSEPGPAQLALPELIEAAVHSGHPAEAAAALDRLTELTRASGTGYAHAVEAGARALLATGDAADDLHRESIARFEGTRIRLGLARAQLRYGEWLRREGRRVDARPQLRAASEALTAMGVDGFAQRARRELLATGETARRRTGEETDQLTARESHIAKLAGAGLTNPEIAAELFISPRTVEWHLRRIFTKVGVTTRRQLRHR